ncbi:MAG TPA: TIR domain-containing protein [Blastocatellia bacterium]|nr:TIR domain-containing protein [Blastocatellia bacterium]
MSKDVSPTPKQGTNVFISYRREDSAGHAGRLFDRISNHFGNRIKIFMDIDSIAPGEDFISVIEGAVGSCEVLIAVLGRDWLDITDEAGKRRLDNPNDFVRVEIATALDRNVRVIPVLVQDAVMPRQEQLPEPLAKLSRRNALELSDARWQYDVNQLIKTIEDVLKQQQAVANTTPIQPAPEEALGLRQWQKHRWPILAVALVMGVILAFGIWRYISSKGNSINSLNSNQTARENKTDSPLPPNNTNSNQSGREDTTPDSQEPAPVTSSLVQVVRVNFVQGFSAQGFFTSSGYIVAFGTGDVKLSDSVMVSWTERNENRKEIAEVVNIKSMVALLKLKKTGLSPHNAPIRLSISLQPNEAVERFIGPGDRTPGRVLEVNAQGKWQGLNGVLVTTKISFAGDAGAPVIDAKGRIVAMVLGGSMKETLSIPIEHIKLLFPEAF